LRSDTSFDVTLANDVGLIHVLQCHFQLYPGQINIANLQVADRAYVGIFMPLMPGAHLTATATWEERIGERREEQRFLVHNTLSDWPFFLYKRISDCLGGGRIASYP